MLAKIKYFCIFIITFLFFFLNYIINLVYAYEYRSPLFDAVQNNDFYSVKKYINNGYAINIRDNYNNTPLTYAIQNNNYDIITLLLQNGANPLIVDSSGDYIYCTGKISNNQTIRKLFRQYKDNLCSNINQIAKNNFSKNIKKTNDIFLSSINWSSIGGTVLTIGLVGGIAAAASGGGGGSDSSSSGNTGAGDGNLGGGEEEIPGEDIEYVDPDNGYLTASQIDVYNDIISGTNTENAKYYSGYTYSVVFPNDETQTQYSNKTEYDSINLAYAWARGFDGSINENSYLLSADGQPNGLGGNIVDASSNMQVGDSVKVAVMDSGVYSINSALKNNLLSNNGAINQNVLYQHYSENCMDNYCYVNNDSSLKVKCETSGTTTLSCNFYDSLNNVINGSSFTVNGANGANPINTLNQHGTMVSSLISANPYQLGDKYVAISGIAPGASIIPYLITSSYNVPNGDTGTTEERSDFAPYEYIGNAFLNAAQSGAVAINNSWGLNMAWDKNATPGSSYLGIGENGKINIYQPDSDEIAYTISEDILYGLYANTYQNTSEEEYVSNFLDSMKTAVNDYDSIFVFAAGNLGQIGPTLDNLIPLYLTNDGDTETFYDKDTGYYKNFITVVAYDNNTNEIYANSNRCGVAKEYCLTAPGVDLLLSSNSDGINNYTSLKSGTSFSAPIVTGSIALLKSAYPYLTGAQITQLLFVTAQDLGAKGVDDVYGWGMIDLEAATRPYGLTVIPGTDNVNTASLSSYSLTDSKIKLNSLIANTIKSEDLNLVVLDSFNRTFNIKLNDFIEAEKDRVNTIDVLNNFATENKIVSLNKEGSLNLYYTDNNNQNLLNTSTKYSKSSYLANNTNKKEIELSYNTNINNNKNNTNNNNNYTNNNNNYTNNNNNYTNNNNTNTNTNTNTYGFSLYYGNNPYNAFIDNKVDFYNNFTLSNSYNYNALNPYFKTNSNNNFAFNNIFKLNDKTTLNLGVLTQNYTINYDKYYYDNNNGNNSKKETEELGNALSFLAGLDYNINNNLSTKLELGFINESETLFGSQWSGAFDIGDNNTTYLASVSSSLNLLDNNKLSLIGKLNFGYTDVNSVSNSLIKDISTLYTNSYAIGLTYNFDTKLKGENSNISFLISQPVNIQSGSLNISLPTSRDNEGNIYYTNHKIDLDNNKETNYQLTYNYSLNDDTAFNLGAIYRDYVQDEVILLLKYRKNF